MNAAWAKLGDATGPLGAPMADQTEDGDVISQRFTGGEISWDSSTNDFTTEPANLASSLSGLEVPGAEQPQAPSTPSAASDTNGTNWFAPQWWWLLILVPVLLLLLGLVFGALWRNRRQGGESVGYEAPDDAELRADALGPRRRGWPRVGRRSGSESLCAVGRRVGL